MYCGFEDCLPSQVGQLSLGSVQPSWCSRCVNLWTLQSLTLYCSFRMRISMKRKLLPRSTVKTYQRPKQPLLSSPKKMQSTAIRRYRATPMIRNTWSNSCYMPHKILCHQLLRNQRCFGNLDCWIVNSSIIKQKKSLICSLLYDDYDDCDAS